MTKPVCVVAGVGPGNGVALARRFASGGYAVALLARSETALKEFEQEISGSKAFPCDMIDETAVETVFESIRQELGPVTVLVYNAGSGRWGNVDEVTAEDFANAWHVNAYGCLLAAQQVLTDMRQAKQGNIIVIGATAALRGGANFTAFASAKAAQRSLAQSLARYLGPQGIHVSYVIIDGVVDSPRTRKLMGDKPDDFFLKSDHIAESVFYLTRQPPSAWTFELDLRPFAEKW